MFLRPRIVIISVSLGVFNVPNLSLCAQCYDQILQHRANQRAGTAVHFVDIFKTTKVSFIQPWKGPPEFDAYSPLSNLIDVNYPEG